MNDIIRCDKCGTIAKPSAATAANITWRQIMRSEAGITEVFWECPRCYAAVMAGKDIANVGLPLFEVTQ